MKDRLIRNLSNRREGVVTNRIETRIRKRGREKTKRPKIEMNIK